MKKLLICIAMAQYALGYATDYYVSLTGNDSNPGTVASPFRTIQKGANVALPGDIVYIRGGEYVASTYYTPLLLYTKAGGTAIAPVTIRNFPGETPILRPLGGTTPEGSGTWALIKIQASESTPTIVPAYIHIEGLVLHGRAMEINPVTEAYNLENQPGRYGNTCTGCEWVRYNGQGLIVTGPFGWSSDLDGLPKYAIPHHITIKKCVVKEFPGAGISLQRFDYCEVSYCEIANNCWYTIFGSTGLNTYMATEYTQGHQHNYATYTNKFLGNKIYGNTLKVVNQNLSQRWDGNGIIIDNYDHSQDGGPGKPAEYQNRGPYQYPSYEGRTLVANNVVFANGGSGIKTYTSNYIDVISNTLYENGIGGYANQYGIAIEDGSGNNVFNNISYNTSNNRHINNTGAYYTVNNITANPGFVSYPAINYFTDGDPSNDHTLIPDIVNSLKLASNSVCVNSSSMQLCTIAGCSDIYVNYDFYRRKRVWDVSDPQADIGAIEYIACRDYLNLGGLVYGGPDPYPFKQRVNEGEIVLARAQKSITISPHPDGEVPGYTNGFVVHYGAVFTAEITTCANANARKDMRSIEADLTVAQENEEQNVNTAYPNPIEEGTTLQFTKMATQYKLMNLSGSELLKGSYADKLNIDGLSKGMYLLDLDGQVHKIVIQ